MTDLQTILSKAHAHRTSGDMDQALERYNDAFNLLIEEAAVYAKGQIDDAVDLDVLRTMTQQLFAYSKTYLKRSLLASEILNAMGELFVSLGEYDKAVQKFQEAIDYIPDGEEYNAPADNLEKIATMTIVPENERSFDE